MSVSVFPEVRPAVLGLGYVGIPLALHLSRHFDCLGFDIDAQRIANLKNGIDTTGECSRDELVASSRLCFSDDAKALRDCNFYIVAVPTPVNDSKSPDLQPLISATRMIASVLKRGDIVVYESTVYPGATEEVCVPILAEISGLEFNRDFFCGYSPERINPGDKNRRLPDIIKITSGSTPEVARHIDAVYQRIVSAGTHLAPSIKVAEAAKAIENTQRDVNIALANELAVIFHRLNIDTEAVLKAAGTKWNFMPVRPGLVGGHCIGVDPYYLIHKAEQVGVHAEIIKAARRINDRMSEYVSSRLIRLMALKQINIVGSRILILGLTFKENCPDLRNTRVVEIIDELKKCHAKVDVYDPWADPTEAKLELGVDLVEHPEPSGYHAVLICVAHQQFRDMGSAGIHAMLQDHGVIFDAKYVLTEEAVDERL